MLCTNIYIYIYLHELAENVRNLNSYIKDTTDFLRKLSEIQQPLPKGAIMFCIDVKALYPSVPRKEARTACQKALQGRTNKSLTTECVLDMLDLVLENNNFSFNDKHYIQRDRIAPRNELCMYVLGRLGKRITSEE
jgi:hypothetical protein